MERGIENYVISSHAIFEMRRRSITEEQLKAVMSYPSQILKTYGGREIYQKILPVREKDFLFRAIVDFNQYPPLIVILYKTSKIDKYWR